MSEQNVAHTPTPWRVGHEGCIEGTQGDFSQGDLSFIPLASPWQEDAWDGHPQAVANARFIVRAVNSHDELVAALGSLIPGNVSLSNERWPDSTVVPLEVTLGELRAARAALSRARGEGE
jgi:hypothetical protein